MNEIANEQADEQIMSVEVSDESLEAAAFAGNAGVYTQLGLCTFASCPG